MSIPNIDMQKLIAEIMKLQKNLHSVQREQVANKRTNKEKSEASRKDRELNEQAETLKKEIELLKSQLADLKSEEKKSLNKEWKVDLFKTNTDKIRSSYTAREPIDSKDEFAQTLANVLLLCIK